MIVNAKEIDIAQVMGIVKENQIVIDVLNNIKNKDKSHIY